jgi:steroid delta-isomerase-like uncharacterized protein
MSTANEVLVRRFYEELWSDWRLDLIDELLAEDVRFRGSLGLTMTGRPAFREYVEGVRVAFPDWHNQIDELFSAADRAVARLTCRGTHNGQLAGIAPTGRRVSYVGVGLFRVVHERIAEAWIVGDTQRIWQALGRLPDPGV